MNTRLTTLLAASLLCASTSALAGPPPIDNVGMRHPNLDAAQHLCTQAYNRLVASQQANEFDEGGHAAHARALLEEANREIAMAARFDNHHGHP